MLIRFLVLTVSTMLVFVSFSQCLGSCDHSLHKALFQRIMFTNSVIAEECSQGSCWVLTRPVCEGECLQFIHTINDLFVAL